MIYLVHPSGAFCACEDAAHAEPYEVQGYARCSLDAFVAAWRAQDMAGYARLRVVLGRPRVAKVEEPTETAPLKAGTIRTRLENGTVLYDARGTNVQ